MLFDDSLTSLHWQHNVGSLSAEPPDRVDSYKPVAAAAAHPPSSNFYQGKVAAILGAPDRGNRVVAAALPPSSSFYQGSTGSPSSPLAGDTVAADQGSPARSLSTGYHHHGPSIPLVKKLEHQTGSTIRPPYSYARLIYMAIQAKQTQVTLSCIYGWIEENFPYYQQAEKNSWHCSVRRTLSTSKCFLRERKDRPMKGGYWQLNPDYAHTFVGHNTDQQGQRSSTRKRKRLATVSHGASSSSNKVARVEPQQPPLLVTEEAHHHTDTVLLQEDDFHLASFMFDTNSDLGENCSSLEELVLRYCDKEESTSTSTSTTLTPVVLEPQGNLPVPVPVPEPEAQAGSQKKQASYTELCGVTVGSISTGHLHTSQHHQDQQASSSTLFPQQQPEELGAGLSLHPWGGIKELEEQAGFFMKMLLSEDSYEDGFWDLL